MYAVVSISLSVLLILLAGSGVFGPEFNLGIPSNIALLAVATLFGIVHVRMMVDSIRDRRRTQSLTLELRDANIRLKRLDRFRSEFLSFASHQVKAPMSVVKGYAQLIMDGTFGSVPTQVTEVAGKIKDSADRLVHLVNNLLDLRRIEEGRMEFSTEHTDIGLLIEQTLGDLRPLADKKGLALRYERGNDALPAMVDIIKFRQVIQNLVENAVKYTDKGSIDITAARNGDTIEIRVRDTGRGISHDLLPELFEQFTREKTTSKRIEGSGLGLYIAKQIVLGHKGTIAAVSDGPGKGSIFIVTIPVATR